MPLKRCKSKGKSGWRWGSSNKCYTGPGAKKKAAKQGAAAHAAGYVEKDFDSMLTELSATDCKVS